MPILSYFPGGDSGEVTVSLPTPYQTGSLTYTGESLTPEWSGYDPEKLTIGGITSATESGSYAAVFTPNVGYCWEDLSIEPIEVYWSIGKAEGRATASVLSISLDTVSSKTSKFTVARLGDGAITVKSSKTSVASVSISGSTVTVTSKGAGTAVITVSVAEGSNYTAAADVKVNVSVYAVWAKYDVSTSSGYKLFVPSQDADLEEVITYCEDGDDEYDGDEWAKEYYDMKQTSAASFFGYYEDISINDSGEIVGGTSASRTSATYAKYTSNPDVWYYVGYVSGSTLYLFEITTVKYTNTSQGEFVEYAYSTNPNAYDNGINADGYWYVKQ